MKKFTELKEAIKPKTIVLYFCECNPPTIDHLIAFSATKRIAESINADYTILVSNNQIDESHSLSLPQKLEYINTFFPGFNIVGASENMKTPVDIARIYNKTYKNLIEITGSDGLNTHTTLHENFNNHAYHYDSIKVISTGEVDPDNSHTSKMMKKAIIEGDIKGLRKGLLTYAREVDIKRLMNDSRRGLGLDTIKETINFTTDEIREKYVAGEIFQENTFVESNDKIFKIINRNSNYLTVSDNNGILSKKWLNSCQPIDITEEVMSQFKGITEMKFSSSDKIKVAKIIGGMLGVDVSKGSNAEQMVNAGLRIVKTKPLNAEAIVILQNMLKTADDAGIAYDQKLVPKLVTNRNNEEIIGEDKDSADRRWIVDPITGKGRWSRAHRVTFNLKTDEPDETIGGRTISDSIEPADKEIIDEVSNAKVGTVLKGRSLAHIATFGSLFGHNNSVETPTATKKLKRTLELVKARDARHKTQESHAYTNESTDDHLYKGASYHTLLKKNNFKFVGINQVGKVYSHPTHGNVFIDKMDQWQHRPHGITPGKGYAGMSPVTLHTHLNSLSESIEDTITDDSQTGIESNPTIKSLSIPIQNAENKKRKKNEDIELIDEIKIKTEQSHIKGNRYIAMNEDEQRIADEHHQYLNTLGGKQVNISNISECSVEELEAEPDNKDNITDEEIDEMIAHVNDWDDIVDAYESSDLSYVTASGKHVADVSDRYEGEEGDPYQQSRGKDADVTSDTFNVTKELPTGNKTDESVELNEVLSKVEIVKTRIQHHTKALNNPVHIAVKHRSSAAQLGRRAKTLAIKILKTNLAKKPLNELSAEERTRIEKIINRKTPLIHRIAIRLLPKIRKIEQSKMTHPNFTKKD